MPDVRVSHLTEVNVTILQMNKRAVIAMVVVCEVYFALMQLWSKSDTFEKREVCVKIVHFHSAESFQKSSLVLHSMKTNGRIPRQLHVSTYMYNALLCDFCGRKEKDGGSFPASTTCWKIKLTMWIVHLTDPEDLCGSSTMSEHRFMVKTLLFSKLRAANMNFNAGMFINYSSLCCLQANEMNIGCRKVRHSYHMEGIRICCLQHTLLQVLNFKLQPQNIFLLRRN